MSGLGSWIGAVAQIVDTDGNVVGAGFLTDADVVLTCAHVVVAARGAPGSVLRLVFSRLTGAPELTGRVDVDSWRPPDGHDIAVIIPDETPAEAPRFALGSASHCRGHKVSSFGFPAHAPAGGHFGYAVVGDLLDVDRTLLQLTDANDLTVGFSGAPVVNEATGLIIGMITAIASPDAYMRGSGIAYATPAQTLRQVWPALTEQQVCPYRGLEIFTAEHAKWFHGRKLAVERVLAALAGPQRALLLLGPSGAGKSSLLQAGVLPALAVGALPSSDRWTPVTVRLGDLLGDVDANGLPGSSRAGIVAAVDHLLAGEPPGARILLVVDQFEELLTPPGTPQQADMARRVIDELVSAIRAPAPLTVILVMRDDFYARLAALAPELLEETARGALNIPATLSRPDLHDIIVKPAAAVGLRCQDGLPERIITDVLAIDPDSPGDAPTTILPLLQLTLHELWQRRRDGCLTHDAYERIGGVTGSMTTWCDTVIRRLSARQRSIARQILTTLVRPADETHRIPAVRQQISLAVLRDLVDVTSVGSRHDADADATDGVLTALTGGRIVITRAVGLSRPGVGGPAQPAAELVHDALIRQWGTLNDWVAEDHRFQDWLRRAREQRSRWTRTASPDDLLHGSDLAEGSQWCRERLLPRDVAAFVVASDRRLRASVRCTRIVNTVLAFLLCVAVGAAAVAFQQRQVAVTAQQVALSRQLAAESKSLMGADPDLASLLAVYGYRIYPTGEAAESLFLAAERPVRYELSGNASGVSSAVFTPNGKTVVTASLDGAARLWDVATGQVQAARDGDYRGPQSAVVASRDGRTIAIVGIDGVARLSDVESGLTRATLGGGHTGGPHSVVFSPDSRTVATAGDDGMVRLWDVDSGNPKGNLGRGHTGGLYSIVFSPDGSTVAAVSDSGAARLWEVASGDLKWTIGGGPVRLWDESGPVRAIAPEQAGQVSAVAFSPDGGMVATMDRAGAVQLWSAQTGQHQATLGGLMNAMAFSPEGATIATAGADGTARLWKVATGKAFATLEGRTGAVTALVFSPNGRTIATAGVDGTARLWDSATGLFRAAIAYPGGGVAEVVFSPDGRTVVTIGSDGKARLWHANARQDLAKLNDHADQVNTVVFSPDGRTIATASDDGTARLSEVATRQLRKELKGHTGRVNAAIYSTDGETLATVSDDGTARLWDVATGRLRVTLTGHRGRVSAAAFSPDSRTVVTASDDDTARLWDVATGAPRATLPSHGPVTAVTFSPDGGTVATASHDGTARLWNVATGQFRATLTGHVSGVFGLVFSPDGGTLATASLDGTAKLWDATTGQLRVTLMGQGGDVFSVVFSPDGATVATASLDRSVRLWDVTSGSIRTVLSGHQGSVLAVAFSPDGRSVATASSDGTARLWDVASGRTRTIFQGHTASVGAVTFSPDGKMVATASADGTARLWESDTLDPDELIGRICRAVGRDLSPEERADHLRGQSGLTVCAR